MDHFQEAIRRIQDNDPKLAKLHLQGKKLDDTHAEMIAAVVWENTNLTYLNLEGNKITDVGAWELSESFKLNKKLAQIDLRNNKIGMNGVTVLLDALKENTTLEQIILDRSAFPESDEDFQAMFKDAEDNNPALWHSIVKAPEPSSSAKGPKTNLTKDCVHMGSKRIIADACKRLSSNDSTLKFLNLMEKGITDPQVEALMNHMKTNTTLQNLNLWNNNIHDEGAIQIASAMLFTPIQNLILRVNKIKDKGAKALAGSFEFNPYLVSLDLRHNLIGNIGSKAIADGLANAMKSTAGYNLQELFFSENQIGDVGAVAIGAMLAVSKTLQVLHLGNNKIGNEGAKAIGEGLGKNRSIKELYLSCNEIGDEGAIEIASKGIELNYSLIRLYMSSNEGITVKGEKALLEAINSKNSNSPLKCVYANAGNICDPDYTLPGTAPKKKPTKQPVADAKAKSHGVSAAPPPPPPDPKVKTHADSADWKMLKKGLQTSAKNLIASKRQGDDYAKKVQSHATSDDWKNLRSGLIEASKSPSFNQRKTMAAKVGAGKEVKPEEPPKTKLKEVPAFLQKLQKEEAAATQAKAKAKTIAKTTIGGGGGGIPNNNNNNVFKKSSNHSTVSSQSPKPAPKNSVASKYNPPKSPMKSPIRKPVVTNNNHHALIKSFNDSVKFGNLNLDDDDDDEDSNIALPSSIARGGIKGSDKAKSSNMAKMNASFSGFNNTPSKEKPTPARQKSGPKNETNPNSLFADARKKAELMAKSGGPGTTTTTTASGTNTKKLITAPTKGNTTTAANNRFSAGNNISKKDDVKRNNSYPKPASKFGGVNSVPSSKPAVAAAGGKNSVKTASSFEESKKKFGAKK